MQKAGTRDAAASRVPRHRCLLTRLLTTGTRARVLAACTTGAARSACAGALALAWALPLSLAARRRHVFSPVQRSVLIGVGRREVQPLDRGSLGSADLTILVRIHL